MKIDDLLENEIENLVESAFQGNFGERYTGVKPIDTFWNYTVPVNFDDDLEIEQLYLNISEVEVPLDLIDEADLDDVIVSGDYAYISSGYGLSILYFKGDLNDESE